MTAAWAVLAATAVLAVAFGLLLRRWARQQHEARRHVVMVERIARLGRLLNAAGSVADLARVVAAEVPGVLEADTARFSDEPALHTASRDPGRPPGAMVRRRITDAGGTAVAALEVAWAPGRYLDDLTLAGLSTVAEMCAQTLARARLADRARRDAVGSRLLAGLAEAAATAGTTDQVARTLVERAAEVPGATAADIGLLSEDRRGLVIVHPGPDAPVEIVSMDGADESRPMVAAIRRSQPMLLGDLDAVADRFPEVVGRMRDAGVVAAASMPLVGHDGHPFGALTLTWDTPQRFDPELVDVLHTTADLCVSSLERARATDLAQTRTTTLARLATRLSAASSFDDVGTAIIEHAPAALAADLALVGVVVDDRFRLLAPSGPQLDVLAPYMDVDLDSDLPALIAWRRCELVTFSSVDAVADEAIAEDLRRLGLRAGACAPLVGSDGAAAGVFMALWAAPPRFDQTLLRRISTVADLCAQSAERSRLFDAEHRLRRDIERSVLASTPPVAGVDVATRYRPAAQSVGMGGDWYDAIVLDGDRLCLLVGDVSGHGVGAIAKMTQIRTMVHTLIAGGMPLAEVLVHASVAMQRDDLGYATLLVAVVDPGAGSLSYVTAGHPPPLLRHPGGTVDTLTGGRHSVLGIDLRPRPPGHVPYPVGARLVLYTDGLVERRGTPIDASIAGLADRVQASDAVTADRLADELLDAWESDGPARDDVALVVARRTG